MIQKEIHLNAVRVLALEAQAILECAERLRQEDLAQSFVKALVLFQRALDAGGKIIVTGVGKSGKVGQKIASTLSSTGNLAVFIHPTEGLHGDIGLVQPQDAVLALSYTGNTEEIVQLIPSFKVRKIPLVGLGGNPLSKLAKQCDAWIDALVRMEACPHNLAPTSSTTLSLALGDAIAVSLMQLRGFNAQEFAKNHPGGSLGRKLTLKVRDLMHQHSSVPVLGPHSTMDEVVIAATEKKLGAVLVVEGPRLLGIITDGDIRRSLQYREKFFTFQAEQVMTRHPVTVHLDVMAQEALELMENRPSQISVLPVVDEVGNWRGLVRLHDLIQSF